jgi:DNA-binding LacI/PurR family transcriptional regulator
VSIAVASYAFSRPDRVAVPTRERVLQTAAALGYAGPDATARALRLGRPNTITLLGSDRAVDLLSDYAAIEVARGLARACDRVGASLVLGGHGGGPSVCFRAAPPARSEPAVLIDPPAPTDDAVVRADLAGGVAAAARHLANLGHTRLAVIAWPGCGERLDGARIGWGARGPIEVIMAPGPNRIDGEPSGRAVLALSPAPTAILALSDPLALEVLDAATHTGLRVPEDLSVGSVDDLPGSAALRLTSVFVPYRPMGEQAGNLLWSILDGAAVPPAHLLPTQLMVRATTGPARPRTRET